MPTQDIILGIHSNSVKGEIDPDSTNHIVRHEIWESGHRKLEFI